MSGPTVLALCGSLRRASFNRKLLATATAGLKARGVEVEFVDLKEHVLPLYDGDVEAAGFPPEVVALKRKVTAHPGLLIVTPEYNHNLPGALKNAIDWVSRPLPADAGHPKELSRPFAGKLAACMGATNGMGGTIYAQLALREVLNTLGCWLVPGALTVSDAANVVSDGGPLKDAAKQAQLERYLDTFTAELSRRAER